MIIIRIPATRARKVNKIFISPGDITTSPASMIEIPETQKHNHYRQRIVDNSRSFDLPDLFFSKHQFGKQAEPSS